MATTCPFGAGAQATSKGVEGTWRTNKFAFKQWIKAAVENPKSPEYKELYAFLTECFADADADRDGLVSASEFDFLVEKAAALPRRFGLAPDWPEQYGSLAKRQEGRRKLFTTMDVDGSGFIGMEEWLGYVVPHIAGKVKTMSSTVDFSRLEVDGKDTFLSFLRTACADKKSGEYKELYRFLLDSFVAADVDHAGAISFDQFDVLLEKSAAAPRRVGLAPETSEMFKDDAEKLRSRRKLFESMDHEGKGTITFDAYLKYTVQHITEKVKATGKAEGWQVDKHDFKRWVKAAMASPDGPEHKELYNFLAECFFDADSDRDGLVNAEEFDFLVEKAAALPRRFGLAPSWRAQYGDVEKRQAGRREMFAKMDAAGRGFIGLEEWLSYVFPHIDEKVKTMSPHTVDFTRLDVQGKDAFIRFCQAACASKESIEYKELYKFLFECFLQADVGQKGAITLQQFDVLVDKSAAAPRSLGLAPKSSEMFQDAAARLAARKKLFESMDTDGNSTITFDEFLKYTVDHIAGKVRDVVAPAAETAAGRCPYGFDR